MQTNTCAALVAFAKDASRVAVKTRLARDIGPELAGRLYCSLLKDCLASIRTLSENNIYLYCYPDEKSSFFEKFEQEFALELRPQRGNDLGERLLSCARELLNEHSAVVIFGTDVPYLPVASIQSALACQHHWNVLLGPCGDGGYYAFGVNKIDDSLLSGVEWGTDSVFLTTVKNCVSLGLEVTFLDILDDIDDLETLQKLCSCLKDDPKIALATRKLLEKEGWLEKKT